MAASLPRCRRDINKEWKYIHGLLRVGWRFEDEDSHRFKKMVKRDVYLFFFRVAVSCVNMAQPSSLQLSIRLSSCKSNQVKLLVANNAFCIMQRATAKSKTGIFRDCGVAEAPPGFQVGWSDCMYFFSLFLFILFAHLELMQPRHSSP
jgi:hypothetical protein